MKLPLRGKAIIGQSGGCTAVINQSFGGVVDAARDSKAITHLWGTFHGITGILEEDLVDLKSQPAPLIRQIRQMPSSVLGSSRHKLSEGEEVRVLEKLKQWNVRYFFMIGGNDTADTVLKVARAADQAHYDLRVVHIPKTIDNDLMETDHCPGYGSVARFAAITTQEAGLDTKAMRKVDPVKVIELMGRNSGWIVAASTLLKNSEMEPPHILQVPEVPFDEGIFLNRVEHTLAKVGWCVVVISETIRDADGHRIGALKEGIVQDPFGHRYVEGAASHLARLVEKNLKVRARYDKPGTIQRMSIPYVSRVDQEEAYRAGRHAVKWATQGLTKVMVSFVRRPAKKYQIEYRPVELEKISNRERYLPSSFLNTERTEMTESFKRYALPLLGENLPQLVSLKAAIPKK